MDTDQDNRMDGQEQRELVIHSRKLTWKPKRSPIKITVLLKRDYMGLHVSLRECSELKAELQLPTSKA